MASYKLDALLIFICFALHLFMYHILLPFFNSFQQNSFGKSQSSNPDGQINLLIHFTKYFSHYEVIQLVASALSAHNISSHTIPEPKPFIVGVPTDFVRVQVNQSSHYIFHFQIIKANHLC